MKSAFTVASLMLAMLFLTGCGGGSGPTAKVVTIKGSDTMVILAQRWAEVYMGLHPDARVQVTGGGSGTGIAALINGGTDICSASRPMKEKEKDQVRSRRGQEVKETPVALDGVAIYVHQSSHLQAITQAHLKGIYTGKITSWGALGGEDARIVAYSRENNSGTYVFFKEHVLNNEDFARDIQTLPGTAAVVNAVSKDPASIGYGGIAYATTIRSLPVRRDDSSEPVQPSLQTVQSGEYPLSRDLYFYTAGEPSGEIKAFMDWVLGQEGQKICEAVGFYPLTQK
jgi:phosphate transport system substrate-binding protein